MENKIKEFCNENNFTISYNVFRDCYEIEYQSINRACMVSLSPKVMLMGDEYIDEYLQTLKNYILEEVR